MPKLSKNKAKTLKSQIAIFQALGDEHRIRVRIEDENVWLTQQIDCGTF